MLEQLTVVEGATFADFIEALAAQPHVAHTPARQDARARSWRRSGTRARRPKGEFFPDTYRFAAGTSDAVILSRAYDGHAARARRRMGGAQPRACPSRRPTRR